MIRSFSTSIASDPVFYECSALAQLLYFKLYMHPQNHLCGLFMYSVDHMAVDIKASRTDAVTALAELVNHGFVEIDRACNLVWIPEMAARVGDVTGPNNKLAPAIKKYMRGVCPRKSVLTDRIYDILFNGLSHRVSDAPSDKVLLGSESVAASDSETEPSCEGFPARAHAERGIEEQHGRQDHAPVSSPHQGPQVSTQAPRMGSDNSERQPKLGLGDSSGGPVCYEPAQDGPVDAGPELQGGLSDEKPSSIGPSDPDRGTERIRGAHEADRSEDSPIQVGQGQEHPDSSDRANAEIRPPRRAGPDQQSPGSDDAGKDHPEVLGAGGAHREQADAPPKRPRKPKQGVMSQAVAEGVAIGLLGELCAARRRVNPQNRRLDAKGNLVELVARLREGVSVEDLRHVIAVMEARARVDSFWAEYFDAITPFRKSKIGKHLAATVEQAGRCVPGSPPADGVNPGARALLEALAARRRKENGNA